MILNPIKLDTDTYPAELRQLLSGAAAYDSSCSREASVIFIDKDGGYFLKSAPKGVLATEAGMTRYFHGKGLSAEVLAYISGDRDWLLTAKIPGQDGVAQKHLDQPESLCDLITERLVLLHSMDFMDCPVPERTRRYLAAAEFNYKTGNYDKTLFPDNWGYASAEQAWRVIETRGRLLQTDTLLHGDYCLPNIILDEWKFSGFIDVGNGGVGDRHIDLFWAIWTLYFNLKTNKYRDRLLDAYGRANVDEERLRIVAAAEVFG